MSDSVAAKLSSESAVVLLGPRQVGKTTLARQIARSGNHGGGTPVYLDLERPSDRRRLDDADAYLRELNGQLVIIDEIHRSPGLFQVLRGIIDERRAMGDETGHFLLLGSAALDLMRQSSESLAGRVSYVELSGFDVTELPDDSATARMLWVRGGFPRSYLASDDAASISWRLDFIRSYLERDVPMFAPRMPSETIGRLWGMLAHGQGTLLNQSRLATSLGVSSPTVGRYIDLLVDLLLVRRLRPWSGNVGKRLIRTPKTYIRDSGLLHTLLDLDSWNDVVGHPIVGASWEGFAVENLIAAAGPRRRPYFYRTADGAEIDLVFERGGKPEMAIEIKLTTAPEVSYGYRSALESVKPPMAFLVHGGVEQWPLPAGVTAISLGALCRQLAASQ